ncbi:MAG: hypothetical protein CVV02_01640 [Firmicutes bacterium HGW-Firmicutes-7]|nr:MAG: hypothetical protein CVV02_01640 [Firmicutes bacterium HGW-Firmicutes-7]
MVFKSKNKAKAIEDTHTKIDSDIYTENMTIPKPQICLIDFDSEVVEAIKKKSFNIRSATFGLPISVPNFENYDKKFCLLNYDLPTNIHEYDIIAIDMNDNKVPIPYDVSQNVRENHKSNKSLCFLTEFPQTIFDPRPFSANILQLGLFNNKAKLILIVFASQKEEQKYSIVSIENDGYRTHEVQKYHNYSFMNNEYFEKNLNGKEIEVVVESDILHNLLSSTNKLFHYEVTFYHPTKWIDSRNVKDENFVPLMINRSKEIVSYFNFSNETLMFVFPQMKEKEKIIIPLLEEILPSMMPDIFPHSTLFSWKDKEEYWLPNHKELDEEKVRIERVYNKKLLEIDLKINKNTIEYSYLHDLITETDEKLVDAVKKYLEWLGFENVNKMDSEDRIKEEDLQVQLENGLLIIEIKGIGGTSKDSDCSQISKIKFRRCKERDKFDVVALYIVNHQRYLAPKQRRNPPFSETQITDAENDERGLLTTWDLFKGYFLIIDGIFKKEDVRTKLLNKGLVKLIPDKLKLLGKVNEIFKDGLVFILKIENYHIKVGDNLTVSLDDSFQLVSINSLQVNDNNVNEVNSGEVGFLINKPIRRNALIYIESSE